MQLRVRFDFQSRIWYLKSEQKIAHARTLHNAYDIIICADKEMRYRSNKKKKIYVDNTAGNNNNNIIMLPVAPAYINLTQTDPT